MRRDRFSRVARISATSAILTLGLTIAAGCASAQTFEVRRAQIWRDVVEPCRAKVQADVDKQVSHERSCDCFPSEVDRHQSLMDLEQIRAHALSQCQSKGQDTLIAFADQHSVALQRQIDQARARIGADKEGFQRLHIATVTDAFETWGDLAEDQRKALWRSSVVSGITGLCEIAREARIANTGFGPKRAEAAVRQLAANGVTEPFLEEGIRAAGSKTGKAQLKALAELAEKIDSNLGRGQALWDQSNGQLKAVADVLGLMLRSPDASGATALGSFAVDYIFAEKALGVITPHLEIALEVPDRQLVAVANLSRRMRQDVQDLAGLEQELKTERRQRQELEYQRGLIFRTTEPG